MLDGYWVRQSAHAPYTNVSTTYSNSITKGRVMRQIFARTFGGLTKQYYIRQFIFGLIFPVMLFFILSQGSQQVPVPLTVIGLFLANTLLYPYSRFVYESIMDFIMGGNVFWVNGFILLVTKLITMSICWFFAIFIAPIGLVYLYFYQGKQNQLQSE